MAAVTICSDFGAQKNKVSQFLYTYIYIFIYIYILLPYIFGAISSELLRGCLPSCSPQ